MRDLPSDRVPNLVDAKQLVDMRHILSLYPAQSPLHAVEEYIVLLLKHPLLPPWMVY